jgi:hypothetical protein
MASCGLQVLTSFSRNILSDGLLVAEMQRSDGVMLNTKANTGPGLEMAVRAYKVNQI